MQGFFYPRSVAVIGVSSRLTNFGQTIVRNLIISGFKGAIYPIGPRGGEIFNLKIERSIAEIPDGVEAAVILTPAATVPELLDECGKKGIRRVITSTSGFSELTGEKDNFESQIKKKLAYWGIRMIGPNCLGLMNVENGFSVPFAPIMRPVLSGDISILSQSGGIGLEYVHMCCTEGLGVNKFVSMGNKLDVPETELLEYLITDPSTKVILMYLESIVNGRALFNLARSSDKPVIIHKSNVSHASSFVGKSHTAAILNDDLIVNAAFRQAGITRARNKHEALTAIKALRLPPLKGDKLVVMSRSGGHAVIAADACAEKDFLLPELPPGVAEEVIKDMRSGVIRLQNPLDLADIFDFSRYSAYINQAIQSSVADGLVFIFGAFYPDEEVIKDILKNISHMMEITQKPIIVSYFSGIDGFDEETKASLKLITSFVDDTCEAIKGMAMLRDFYESRKNRRTIPEAQNITENIKTIILRPEANIKKDFHPGKNPQFPELAELLTDYSINVQPWMVAFDEEEAVKCANELGYPVVLKIISPQIVHKTDTGAIKLHISSPDEVRRGVGEILANVTKNAPGAVIDGILVQKMAPAGKEIIISGKQDSSFGPVVMTGMGGIFVEIFGDVTARLAPVNKQEARKMIRELKGYKILQGARGELPVDMEAIAGAIFNISRLMCDYPGFEQFEINPFLLLPGKKGGLALDARAYLKKCSISNPY